MFSEVYWHHAVRAATAMLQRAVWIVRPAIDPALLMRSDDASFADWLTRTAAGTPAAPLAAGLFGPARRLFKRAASFDALHHPEVHRAIAGRSYADTAAISARLAERLSARLATPVDPHTLLVDAPPAEREVEFRLQVRERPARHAMGATHRWHRLEDVSPVVRSLAHEQFDDLVKRVRIFADPVPAAAIASCEGLEDIILEAVAG
jgi:hypothetical protein